MNAPHRRPTLLRPPRARQARSRGLLFGLALGAVIACLVIGCAPAGHTPNDRQAGSCATSSLPAGAGTPVCALITWYGTPDNDPPGDRRIAHPGPPPRHRQAGGTGSYHDPVTFATEYPETYPVGTRIYFPRVQKYFISEDGCACKLGTNHVDLWMDSGPTDQRVLRCEENPKINGRLTIITEPAPDLPVTTRPIYDNGHCRP